MDYTTFTCNANNRRIETFRIVAIYSLFGLAWIYGSDTLLGWLVHNPAVMVKIAVIKGSLFILCTATLLYFLINRFIRQLISSESARMESLANYKTIFNTTNEAIFVHDARSGHILDVNDRMLEIYGYTHEEALAVEIGDLSEGTSPYSQTEATEKFRKALFEGPQVFVWHSRKKNGEVFWSEVSLRLITINGSDRIIAVVRDISERKHAEESLKFEMNRAQSYLDTVETIIIALDVEGSITVANRKACQVLGYSEDELLGKFWFKTCLAQPEGMDIAYPYFLENIADNQDGPEYFENQIITRNSELRHIAWHNAVLRDEQGRIYSTLSAGEDVTDRKKDQEALEKSTAKIVSLVNNVPGHVAFVNAATLKYEFVNAAFETSFGIPQEKITGSFVKDIIGETDFQFTLKYLEEARSGKTASYENAFDLVSGKRWIQVNYNPIKDTNGQVVSIVVHSFDITNLKEHETERLKIEKLESLGVLAGGIAHDFNNILTGVMGYISLAKSFIDDSHKSFNALDVAEKASVRAAELARQLLVFAKGGEPVKKIVSIQDIVSESVSLVLRGSNVKGTIDIPDSMYSIEADSGQISQIFHNILINAMQAMPDGGIATISARDKMLDADNSLALPPGPYACISFTDEGCGIADTDVNKIFDPYFTTKASGNGLGLASCRSIIIKHGGHIGVTSRVGKGTTFTIHLPSIGESVDLINDESDAHNFKDQLGGAILVMDDEEMIRDLAAAMLEEIGLQVTVCCDGAEAIRHYLNAKEFGTPFMAVIMDLTIPGGMGGEEAAKEILAIDPAACLIVSSGYSNDPIMSDYSSYGFTGVITKPYRISELLQTLHSALNNW